MTLFKDFRANTANVSSRADRTWANTEAECFDALATGAYNLVHPERPFWLGLHARPLLVLSSARSAGKIKVREKGCKDGDLRLCMQVELGIGRRFRRWPCAVIQASRHADRGPAKRRTRNAANQHGQRTRLGRAAQKAKSTRQNCVLRDWLAQSKPTSFLGCFKPTDLLVQCLETAMARAEP